MAECALCASSAHDVHHASVCVNVVIGVLVVHCELHVDVRVHVIPHCDDAVVGLTLGLIAHVVIVVLVVAIFQRIYCIGGILFTLCASSMHDVHHAIVGVNVVIGVVLGELHVVVRVHVPLVVYDDAVIDLTLVLIALVVIVVFVVAIFH